MAISYNTGSVAHLTASTSSSTTTVPAGVLSGDAVFVLVWGFTTASGTLTPTLSSTKTAPSLVGTKQNSTGGGIQTSAGVFLINAGSSDAGATLTYGLSGGSGGSYWFNVGIVSYTGANATPVDVNAGTEFFSASSAGTTVTPSATTVAAGDWQIQFIGCGPPSGANFTVPGGITQREAITSGTNAGLLLQIGDSNGSVGGAGTSIGNTTWTCSGEGASNTWSNSFTVGLQPPSAAAPAAFVPQQPPVVAVINPGWRNAAHSR